MQQQQKSSDLPRFKNCPVCPAQATPNSSGLHVLNHMRQIIVVYQNVMKVVCYESSATLGSFIGQAGQPVGRQLPYEHDFSFNKVK
jgi:hypothetical protein